MTPKDPFLEVTFWDKFWRPIRSRVLLFTLENREKLPKDRIGHPLTCVYPDVCLGIAHVSGKALLPGQGVW